MMNRKIKVLITSSYTWYNKGDAAILLGMIKGLRQFIPDIDIAALSFTPEIDCNKYGIKVYSNLLNPYPYENNFKYKILVSIKMFERAIRYFFWARTGLSILRESEKRILEYYQNADLIICTRTLLTGDYA